LREKLELSGFKTHLDLRNEKIGFKIREHTIAKVPFLLVVGDKEMENGTVAVRTRKGEDLGVMTQDEVVALFSRESESKGRSIDNDKSA
ncbi:His/Gly/Thr/Pro-type tRNA ligase C-terminal domain-containing protein, partial [Oleiphilus sp. HI0079]